MFFTLILENANGDCVDMNSTANQYMISKIDGLKPFHNNSRTVNAIP